MNASFQITVCASGGGGNFQALIDSQKDSGYQINHLIVDRECGAIERAKNSQIPYVFHDRKGLKEIFWDMFLFSVPKDTNLIVLAGFMPIVPDYVCKLWEGRMINTHPSLLPKYGGKGMYGIKVQEAVMRAKEKYAGCTIHYVSSGIDEGGIILQSKLEIDYHLTPWQLGGEVFKMENKLLVQAVKLLMEKNNNG
jgi:phosphoribosylglycinamide formyltransferase-1